MCQLIQGGCMARRLLCLQCSKLFYSKLLREGLMKKWLLPALLLGASVAYAADYGSSSPGPASKPSSGSTGSGQSPDKGRTGSSAAMDSGSSAAMHDDEMKKGKGKKGESK